MKTTTMTLLLLLGPALGSLPAAHAQFAQATSTVLVYAAAAEKEATVVDDREIALRVQSALYKDKRLSGLALTVKATDGTVELSGLADSRAQADRALQIARAVPGVKAVTSEIRVN